MMFDHSLGADQSRLSNAVRQPPLTILGACIALEAGSVAGDTSNECSIQESRNTGTFFAVMHEPADQSCRDSLCECVRCCRGFAAKFTAKRQTIEIVTIGLALDIRHSSHCILRFDRNNVLNGSKERALS